MKRLLQSLSPNIFVGDIVRNVQDHKMLKHKTYTVEEIRTNGLGESFIIYYDGTRKNVCVTAPLRIIKKRVIKTFEKEFDRIFRRRPILEVDKVKTLRDLCVDRNIGYLYEEMVASKTVNEFNANMSLINKMLNN